MAFYMSSNRGDYCLRRFQQHTALYKRDTAKGAYEGLGELPGYQERSPRFV
jgi:hypothetical protein